MNDASDRRDAALRNSLATSAARAIEQFAAGFQRLHAHLFDAPWRDCDDAGQRC